MADEMPQAEEVEVFTQDNVGEIRKVEGFRITPTEKELIGKLTDYAYMAGRIKEHTFQAFMLYALNCAYGYLQQDFRGAGKN